MSTRAIVLTVTAVLAAVALVMAAGCFETKTQSPFSDRQVTAGELAAEVAKFDAEQARAEARDKAKAEAELRQARSTAEVEARKLVAQGEISLAELQAKTDERVQSALAAFNTAQTERAATLEAITAGVEQARADLTRKNEQRAGLLSILGSIPGASAIPGFGQLQSLASLLLLGGGGAAAGVAVGRRGKAQLKQELEDTRLGAERIVDSIDVARAKDSVFDEAFRRLKPLIADWQGAAGKNLVTDLQRSDPKAA